MPTVLVTALVVAASLGGGPRNPEPAATTPDAAAKRPAFRGCATDISHPLQVTVALDRPVRPGGRVTARVEISSRIPLDTATLRLTPPADVRLLGAPARELGLVRAGETRSLEIDLVAPNERSRRTVQVTLEATSDGVPVSRGTILNLSFEDEPFRIVTTPDGRRIREVPARRIG